FFLNELTVTAGGRPLAFAGPTETHAKAWIGGSVTNAAAAVDGHPDTGWSASGNAGRRSVAVFPLAEPLAADTPAPVEMLVHRHYPVGFGRFRVCATADTRKPRAEDTPTEVEELLLAPDEALTPAQRDRLLRHFLEVMPELKAARDETDAVRKQAPAVPTTLV